MENYLDEYAVKSLTSSINAFNREDKYNCMKVMITGHRYFENPSWVERYITDRLERLKRNDNQIIGLSGMCFGVDLLFCEICLKLDIKYDAYIPFESFAKRWNIKDKKQYHDLLDKADKKFIINKKYSEYAFFNRNDRLVADCDYAIIVYDGRRTGGTLHAMNGIIKTDKNYFLINPVTLKTKEKEQLQLL